jgi:hypothetical protein
MLHFAYGSNMSRAVMRKHAPLAQPLGAARLAHHRFLISADGYASVAPVRGRAVYGVLWRLTPRDRVTLDCWENIAGGLYHAETLPVQHAGRRCLALVYMARAPGNRRTGNTKSGYMEIVISAAREWRLPDGYIAFLQRFLPSRPLAHDPEKWTPVFR